MHGKRCGHGQPHYARKMVVPGPVPLSRKGEGTGVRIGVRFPSCPPSRDGKRTLCQIVVPSLEASMPVFATRPLQHTSWWSRLLGSRSPENAAIDLENLLAAGKGGVADISQA